MHIAVVNRSSDVTQAQLTAMVAACAVQLERDVRPAWAGPACPVKPYRRGARLPGNSLAIVLLPESDDAEERKEGYLGYHAEDDNGVRWHRH